MNFPPRLLRLLLAALTLPLSQMVFQGCSTYGDSSPQDIARWRNMPKVFVSVDGLPLGVTPVVAHITRDDVHRVRIEMPGYQPLEFPVKIQPDKLVAATLADDSAFLVNIMVDGTTGAVQRFDQAHRVPHFSRPVDAATPRDTLEVCTTVGGDDDAHNVGHLRRR